MDKSTIFFIKALIAGITTAVVIPKAEYKKYFTYGLIFGGFAYILINLIIVPVLHLAKYLNMGAFGVYQLFSFWTPITYSFVFMFFLYCLPSTKTFFYLYLVAFAVFGYTLGVMLENYGVFRYIGPWRFLAPLGLFIWFRIVAWIYMKVEKIKFEKR